jgi:hypothetical protein
MPKGKNKNENKVEAAMATISAMLVLFTALIDPIYSVILSGILLISFAVYKFTRKK